MRWTGYAIAALIVIALAFYVFRQDPAVSNLVSILPDGLPTEFTVTMRGSEQQVVSDKVRTHGLELPLDRSKAGMLSEYLRAVAVPRERIVPGIGRADLPSYGIDGTNSVNAADIHVEWGAVAESTGKRQGYFWNGSAIFSVDAALVDRLNDIATRLDDLRLLPTSQVERLVVDGLEILQRGAGFVCLLQPQRPDFGSRVGNLMVLLQAVPFAELDAALPQGVERVSSFDLTYLNDARRRAVTLWKSGDSGLLQVDQLPPQRLNPALYAQFAEAVRDFGRDFLFSINRSFIRDPVDDVVVSRAGAEWFRLERRGKENVRQGRSQWDLLWGKGRENAAADAVSKLLDAFNRLTVTAPRQILPIEPRPADAIVIELSGTMEQKRISLTLSGNQARSLTHVGTVESIDPMLARISPDVFLETVLIGRESERIVKIQRRFLDEQPERGEVFTASAAGTWQQTFPQAAPVDQPALIRLATALGQARAVSARAATPADLAIVEHPQRAFAVRAAPRPAGKANDLTNIDETTALEAEFLCAREGDHWRAVDGEGLISYEIDDELMEQISQPLVDRLIFPAIPALIARVEVQSPSGHYLLVQRQSHWFVQPDVGEAIAADDVQVRRFFRRLTQARAEREEGAALMLTPDEIAGKVICAFPEIDEKPQRMTLYIGKPRDGQIALFAEATRPGAVAKGRHYVSEDQMEWLLPSADSFRTAK